MHMRKIHVPEYKNNSNSTILNEAFLFFEVLLNIVYICCSLCILMQSL